MSTYQIIGLMFAILGGISLLSLVFEAMKSKSLDLDFMPITTLLMWVTRLGVGILFIYSGFVKANDYIGFAYKLEEYFVVFGEHFPFSKPFWDLFVPLAEPMAWFISVFEIALAFAIIVGWRMNLTMWLTMLMMVFFTVLTGYSHVTGAVTDCGCFGDALKLEPWESFMKDIILTLALIPLFLVRKSVHPTPNNRIAGFIVALSFLISGFFSYYCHENLPWIDYRAYKVGVDLNKCTTELTVEGIIKCKDWYPSFEEEEINLFEGSTLMVIFYDLKKAPEKALRVSGELGRSLAGEGVKVVGSTSSSGKDWVKYSKELQLDYPISYLDQTVLKTVIRAHPGYVLMKDGVIMGKWHYNNAPTKEEVLGLL
ncbi:MAG: DoxX family protein [Bacteroidia bacterium]|nr:DoxX family protein [Bacteroidia bacterium]